MKENISFTIKSDVKECIDALRGDIPRSRFIVRLLESYIRKHGKDGISIKYYPVDYSFEASNQQATNAKEEN